MTKRKIKDRVSRVGHSLDSIYTSMLARCNNPNVNNYERYGARGVYVCERWLGKYGFTNFVKDMGERPDTRHSLDKDSIVSGNKCYSPEFCKWSDVHTQNKNRRKSVSEVGVTFNKRDKTWSPRLKVDGKLFCFGDCKSYDRACIARVNGEAAYLSNKNGRMGVYR